ncbi:helix-turn-helix domain-containing protein [Halorientalis brevis]|uniref:Helix-turn-helix domain-containing protein n=1 Tax=Halorientalis brevis TaxID=1126241 RepID=A0ABD6CFS5_9EURY|nr:helix-turn-helix domain-containing protein [Halorientalis brevis]
MPTVAEFTIPASDFPLGGAFQQLQGVAVELERVVPTGSGVVPYLWVSGVTADAIRAALTDRPEIETMQVVDTINDQHLLRVVWSVEHDGILRSIADSDVSMLSGTGTATEWIFEIRAEDRDDIARFQERCRERSIPVQISAITRLSENLFSDRYGLTAPQREALQVAFDQGYFEEPREATLEEIAGTLGITRQALAARLRRAHRNLIRHTVAPP